MSKPAQDDIIRKAIDVSNFCMELSQRFPDRYSKVSQPYCDFSYAEALLIWEARGRPPQDFFSNAHESEEWEMKDPLTGAVQTVQGGDKFFTEFREEITLRFGLPVLTKAEGRAREEALGDRCHQEKVWGDGKHHG